MYTILHSSKENTIFVNILAHMKLPYFIPLLAIILKDNITKFPYIKKIQMEKNAFENNQKASIKKSLL